MPAGKEFTIENSYGDKLFEIRPGRNLPGYFVNGLTYNDPGVVAATAQFYFSPNDMRKMALWILKNLTDRPGEDEPKSGFRSSEA
jgi:hypothetical protein